MNPVNYAFMFILLNTISFDSATAQINEKCATLKFREKRLECISILDCPALLNLLKNKKPTPQDLELLSDLNCGYDGRIPRVCCIPLLRPIQNQTQIPITSSTKQDSPVTDVRFHPRLTSLLPKSCGIIRDDDKIVLGEAAQLYEFPWMALLGYTIRTSNNIDFACGGTLINKRYVLTAAHCLDVKARRLVIVRLGEYDKSSSLDCADTMCAPPVQDIDIEEAIRHPQYSTRTYKNDIALIRLSTNAIINEATIPICLPIGPDEQSKDLTYKQVTVTGWGKTLSERESSILLKVDIPVTPRNKCADQYKANGKDIDETQFCIGTGNGKDSCSGDSGGPAQYITSRNEETVYVQYGIVSYGPLHCGNPDLPGVYTRVGFFMQWILDTMRP